MGLRAPSMLRDGESERANELRFPSLSAVSDGPRTAIHNPWWWLFIFELSPVFRSASHSARTRTRLFFRVRAYHAAPQISHRWRPLCRPET